MARKIQTRGMLTGETGLLLAVMATAANDLADGSERMRQDAASYFAGPVFREHKDWLGLPLDWMPAGLE